LYTINFIASSATSSATELKESKIVYIHAASK